MPELPEVETIRKTLEQLVLNKEIKEVSVHWPRIIQYPEEVDEFKLLLQGEKIESIDRRGKFLLFYLTDYVLISHLRMEGKYRLVREKETIDKHTHVVFHFNDQTELRYNDVRKFGTMHVYRRGEEFERKPLNQLGPDPFEPAYTMTYLKEKLKSTTRMIKAVLLDQTVISGLGNIYVDEVLFLAKIHPETRANRLTEKQIKSLWKYARIVLDEAVKLGGTTIRSYVDGKGEMGMFQQQLYAYGQTGKSCQHCGTPIEKIKVTGRGTHICPTCQKK